MKNLDTNISLGFTQREIDVIRSALRLQQETHKRNGFNVLVIEAEELRSKINDSVIDKMLSMD